jgi:hypothetical protein
VLKNPKVILLYANIFSRLDLNHHASPILRPGRLFSVGAAPTSGKKAYREQFIMRQKVILVESCTLCPYYLWYKYLDAHECAFKYNNQLDGRDTIPIWCPLPDAPDNLATFRSATT